MDISASTINELFVEKLNSPDGLEKVAAEGSAFIRQKLREVSFARKIIQPDYVTKADCQRSVNHDGLVKIVDIEPESKAMTVNFRGQPDTSYVMGERYEIPFFAISSDDFQKTEEELLAYEMPLTEVIERNSVKDIQKIEDTSFLTQVDAAITTSSLTASGLWNATTGAIPKTAFFDLFNLLDSNELKAETMLMSNPTYNRLFLYDATTIGDQVGSELAVNGYTYQQFLGRKLIVSNKTDLLTADSGATEYVYIFAGQEFLGNFFILNDTKFWIDKQKNIISWAAYETLGIGIGNTNACGRLTLTSA
jgi:hypothetical protein